MNIKKTLWILSLVVLVVICVGMAIVLKLRDGTQVVPVPHVQSPEEIKEDQRAAFWNAMIVHDTVQIKNSIANAPWLADEPRGGGMHPIHDMAHGYEPQMVQYFLDLGVPVDVRNKDGTTSLIFAAIGAAHSKDNIEKSLQIAKLLLAYHADINAVDNNHDTALLDASWAGGKEMVQFLLDNGADPTIADSNGDTPLSIATKRKKLEVVNILTKYLQDHNLPVK